jgi:hypothetical protein
MRQPIQRIVALAALVASLPVVRAADDKSAAPLSATVTTAEGEQSAGTIAGLRDGKLTLATDPPRSFDLADLERIELGKVAAPASGSPLEWIGQDNHDLVQVGGATDGNGIQDLHLRADGLAPKALKQIVVVCRLPKQLRVWRLDTSQSPHWRLAIARSTLAPQADLYIEPPADDCFGMKFDVTFTYEDGATTKSNVTATTHTSDQTKFDRGAQAGQASAAQGTSAPTSASTEVYLIDQGRLQGEIVSLDPQSLVLHASWKTDVEVPILHVKGAWFGNKAPAGARADFDKQLAAPIAEDAVFLTAPDGTKAQITGSVLALGADKLQIRFDGEDRSIKKDKLLGVVFAAHPKIPPVAGPYQAFVLTTGESTSGHWRGLSDGTLDIETPWQAHWRVPFASVAEIRIRNGKLVYLSDLEPTAVEEIPYFGRVVPWGRDRGFDGNPPSMKGKKPARSLAMHSRSVLTYALDEQFTAFKATVGFDDSSANRGRVSCRIMVDGRELFAQNDLRADQDPLAVEVKVDGAKQMSLEVDFGEHEDIGDRVLWAEPRLFRMPSK